MAAEHRRSRIFLSTARWHRGNHADRDGFPDADPVPGTSLLLMLV